MHETGENQHTAKFTSHRVITPQAWGYFLTSRSSFSIDHVSSNIPRSPLRMHTGKCVRYKLTDQSINEMKLIQTAFCSQGEPECISLRSK